MPIPPSPPLDETITPGQLGHIADHEAIASALNNAFLAGSKLEELYIPTAFTSAAIQTQVDAASADGGGTVFCPPGTYVAVLADQGVDGGFYASAVMMRSNVTLRFAPGAVLQLEPTAALPGGFASLEATIIGCVDTGGSGTNENIRLIGVEVDGNSDNQAAITVYAGISIFGVTGAWVTDCKVRNVYGTGSAAPNETLHFDAVKSRDVHFVDCEADGSTATDTATGFSANDSYGVTWEGCVAHDMAHGQGFTAWQSAGLRYSACHAYACVGQAGFNSERSEGIVYAACVSGGRSASVASGPSGGIPGSTDFGNATGFQTQGCTDVAYVGCESTYNGLGLNIIDNSAIVPTLSNDTVTWIGGILDDNTTNYGLDAGQTGVWIDTSHGDDFRYVRGAAPLVAYTDTSGASGLRTVVEGVTGFFWRLQSDGVNVLVVDGGTTPVGGDSDRTDRFGDVAFSYNITAEGVGTKMKVGSGALVLADSDFAHRPADGTLGFVRDTATGITRMTVRANGTWWPLLGASSGGTLFAPSFRSPSGSQAQFGSDGASSAVLLTNATTRLTIGSAGGFTVAAGNAFVFAAATTSIASANLPHGTAPSAPTDGDMWTTTAGLFVRINGVTVGPLS